MVAQLVSTLLFCCGENEFLKSKFPWNKNNSHGTDEDVSSDTKPSHNLFNKKNKNAKFSDKDMKHENCKWKSLPNKVRRAIQDVGISQEQWDNKDNTVAVFQKHWEDLETKEVEAMELLGWDEPSWEHRYEETSWEDLPEQAKKAATAAGFDEDTWEEDEWPDNLHKSWADLSETDRNAMMVLGWHEAKWD
jgi:transcriptional regulator of met regulon